MVSRRAAAALGARLLLARRRRAGLDGPERSSPTSSIRTAHGAADAERFITALAAQLGVTADHVQAGYEDVWYYLWRERQLPVNVDPVRRAARRRAGARPPAPRLHAGSGRRRRLRAAASAGRRTRRTLATGPWFLRDERLYLVPGDSPMGFGCRSTRCRGRSRTTASTIDELDPFAPRAPLAAAGRRDDPQLASQAAAVHGVHRSGRAVTRRRRRATRGRGVHRTLAGARRIGRRRRPLGAVRRAARRRPVHLHAAGRGARGLSRSRRRHRSDVAGARHARAARRLSAAERPAAAALSASRRIRA